MLAYCICVRTACSPLSLLCMTHTGNLLRVHQASVTATPKYSKHMQYIVSGILDNVMLHIL